MNIANVAQREVLLFDLDGTLVDSATDLHRAMNMSLNALQLPTVTEAQVRIWVGKGTALFCQSTLQYLTGKVDPAQQQQLLDTFLKIYNADPCVETRPFDGILEFLEWGLAQKKTMICVTNKPELPARAIVDHLGIIILWMSSVEIVSKSANLIRVNCYIVLSNMHKAKIRS